MWGTTVCIPTLEEIYDQVATPLSSAFTDMYNTIAGAVQDSLGGVYDTISSGLSSVWDALQNVYKHVNELWGELSEFAVDLSADLQNLGGNILDGLGAIGSTLVDGLTNVGNIIWGGIQQISSTFVEGIQAAGGYLFQLFQQAVTSKPVEDIKNMIFSPLEDLEKILTSILTPHSPKEPEKAYEEAQNLFMQGNLILAAYAAAKIGIEAATIGQVDVNLAAFDDIPLISTYKRLIEDVSYAEYEPSLLIPLRYYYMQQHTPMIPSASDLIRFVVREVFPLDKLPQAPEEFKKYMRYQGYRDEWSNAYWEAHWELPPLTSLYEAFHRGIISEKELRKYIVWHDYKPSARPGISKSDVDIILELTYRLPTRTEARMMYEMGLISDPEIQEIVKAEGIHPKYQDQFSKFIKEFALRDDLRRIEREARYLFVQGKIDESKYREYLSQARIPSDYHDFFVKLAQMEKERKTKENEQQLREITYSQFAYAFRQNILSESEFLAKLRELGYTENAAKLILDIERARKFDSLVDKYISKLEDLLESGWIDENDFRSNLSTLGIPDEEIDLRLQIISLERVPKRKKLTLSQIVKAYKAGIIDLTTAIDKLRDLGYADEDIAILIQLYLAVEAD